MMPNDTVTTGISEDSSTADRVVAIEMSMPSVTPAKAQWARASLKNDMRLPTTSAPTEPQIRLTRTTMSSARTLNASLSQKSGGSESAARLIASFNQSVGIGTAPLSSQAGNPAGTGVAGTASALRISAASPVSN